MLISNPVMLPLSCIIVTKNEEDRLARCLKALPKCAQVIVVDSNSADQTPAIARAHDAELASFTWNGQYPKKRQWCLDNLNLRHDWVLFIDADEICTPQLAAELQAMEWGALDNVAGFFIRGAYLWRGKALRFGMQNNKLCLLNHRKMEFPAVDDLHCSGMGEIEGHYQPVLKDGSSGAIGRLRAPLYHDALDDKQAWLARHERYARWEQCMNNGNLWPKDPVLWRETLKSVFRKLPCRGLWAFLHSYIFKLGVIDGIGGYELARRRFVYYRMIARKRQ